MSDKCPSCNSALQFKKPVELNQSVSCANCGLELEVVWLYPLEMVKVPEFPPYPKQIKDQGGQDKISPDLIP